MIGIGPLLSDFPPDFVVFHEIKARGACLTLLEKWHSVP